MKTFKFQHFVILSTFLIGHIFGYSQTISTDAVTGPFCQGDPITVSFTVSSSFTPGNTFTLEMSDETGSFASPTTIATLSGISSGTINGNLPSTLTSGTAYRFRVTGNSPMVNGTDNGADITISGNSIDPSVFGNNIWHAYCYIGSNSNPALNTYVGMYTDASVSFNSTDDWAVNSSPSNATNATYVGCPIPSNNFFVQYKRQGFPCDYYTINIADALGNAGHDDGAELLIDGVSVWSLNACCQAHLGVWTGFLGPTSTVEFRWREGGGSSYGRVTFVSTPAPSVSPDVTICAGTSTTLTASGSVNYDWSTNTTHVVGATNTSNLIVSPAGGTPDGIETYTVTTTDAATGCTVSNTVDVTISATPSTAVTPINETYCQAGSVNAIATGANTYTWSPMTDITINSPSGHDVTLAPSSTTVYTVTGDNGCSTNTATSTVTVIPASGDTAVYGANVWNAYCFNGNNSNLNSNEYRGFYSDPSVSFDSDNLWATNGTPSDAAGYAGCDVGVNTHTVMYKREGFPCGYYQVDVAGIAGEYGHDDGANLYIDDVLVWSNAGCCQAHIDVWQGYLGPNSRIKFYWREGGGSSYGRLTLTELQHPTTSANATVCAGASVTVYASGAANYDWSTNTTYISSATNTSSIVVSPPLATPNSVETYTVSTTDAGTGCTISNTVDVTIDPASNTVVDPLTDSYCSSGVVNATATGASTYTWSPMTGVSFNFPNGSDVDLSPSVTTTYTVTGTNGCSSTTENVTITVYNPVGDTSVFGDGQWNVYCYDGSSYNPNANTYLGDYTEPNLTFSSTDQWNANGTPSDAPSYVGCPIGINNHSVIYKRTNFACGYYQINVAGTDGSAGHDDGARLYIDGVLVWSNNGCCQSHINVWTGAVGPTTEIEFRWREGGGGSYGKLHFIPVPHPTVSPDISTTPGSSETLTASGASNYDWSSNTTYVTSGTTGSNLDLTIPGSEFGSIQTYTVSTTDPTTGCVFSEDIIVTIIAPLPVSFIDFEAYCLNGRTQVNWSTASERDNDYFTLEGSNDGFNFTAIKQISGSGNSNKVMNYSTFINDVDVAYLRIKQTDFNGKSDSFKVISNPACENTTEDIQVVPNPNGGSFTIRTSTLSKTHDFRIIDIQGREVLRTSNTKVQLPQNIRPGIYLLESNVNGEVKTVRFEVM